MKERIRVIKFVLFSISAGVIEFISFAALDHFTNWQYWPKYLIALILSVLWNFTLNREFTFTIVVGQNAIYCECAVNSAKRIEVREINSEQADFN